MPDILALRIVTSEDEDDGTLRHFVVKREYAEGSIMMSMGKFPAAALPEPGQPAPMMYRYLLRDLSPCAQTGCSERLPQACCNSLLGQKSFIVRVAYT